MQKNIPIGSAPRKSIPQYRAHAPATTRFLLFPEDYAQKSTARKASLMNLTRDRKNHFPDRVVCGDRLGDGPVVPPEVLSRYTLKDSGRSSGLGGAIGGSDSSSHPTIANQHHSILERLDSALGIYPGEQ